MKHSVLLFLALVFFPCAAYGQKAEGRTCRIIFLERPASAPATMHLFDGVTSREVDLPDMSLSKVYDLRSGKLPLALLTAPLGDPKELPPGAPSVIVPENATDIYLLVMSDPANKVAPVRLEVVDAGGAKLRRGQTLWFNLTQFKVGGTLGSEKFVIKPLSRALMDAPRNDRGDYPVSLGYLMEGNKQLYPICESRWSHDPRSRNLGFVIDRGGIKSPLVMLFPDFRSEPEKPSKRASQP